MYRDTRLAGDWQDLLGRLDRDDTAERWGRLEPALAGLVRWEQLAADLRCGSDLARADAVLGALVRLAAADGHDDGDAVLLLLHLLSDGASALAARLPDLAGDVLALVVGELTVQIRTFPWRRRTRAYAASLLLDTKAAVLRELLPHRTRTRPHAREVLVDPTDPRQVGALLDAPAASPDNADDITLVDLLAWACWTGVVGSDDAALLLEVERTRECGGDAQLRVARAWRINERTLRRRRERTLAALQQASSGYLAACA